MAENAVMYSAVYGDVDDALADLDAIEQLHQDEMIGKYDAAVLDKADGEPHVVKRMDRPFIRVIPEWLGAGTLPRHDLREAADALDSSEAALIVVGDPTIEKGVEKAITRANKKVEHDLDVAADELADSLAEAEAPGE
jgi:hypothetical protein